MPYSWKEPVHDTISEVKKMKIDRSGPQEKMYYYYFCLTRIGIKLSLITHSYTYMYRYSQRLSKKLLLVAGVNYQKDTQLKIVKRARYFGTVISKQNVLIQSSLHKSEIYLGEDTEIRNKKKRLKTSKKNSFPDTKCLMTI